MAGEFENDALGDATLAPGTPDENLVADVGDSSPGNISPLLVPDFSNTEEAGPGPISNANNARMNSYLRLGMADSRAGDKSQVALGEDLAALVLGFTDDFRDRGDPNGGAGADAPDGADVARNAGLLTGAQAGSGTPYAEPPTPGPDFRQPESLQLHTKGGWRDHSDGNRISTTRGDKVEVIRGNYKLLVLGRNDDVGNAVGFDMSGGQVDTDGADLARPTAADLAAGAATGLDMTWQWKADSDGNFRWHVTTLQGSTGTVDGDASTASNPTMVTQTWAYDVTSDTTANTITTNTTTTGDNDSTTTSNSGSVSAVTTANAGTVTSTVNASTINSSTSAAGSNTTTTSGDSVTTTVFAGSGVTNNANGVTLTNSTSFVNIASSTIAAAQESFQLALLNLGLTIAGAQVQVTAGEALLSGTFFGVNITEMAGLMNITNWNGMVLDAHQGLHADNHAGMHIDNHSGIHLDLHTGSHISQDTGVKIEAVTGTQLTDILGAHCHMLTQHLEIAEADQIKVAATYMRL